MKFFRKSFLTLVLFFCLFLSCSSTADSSYDADELLITSIASVLEKFHFIKKDINQTFFDQVMDKYFDIVDNDKSIFTESEYQELKSYNHLDIENVTGGFTEIRKIPEISEKILQLRGKKFKEFLVDYLSKPLEYNGEATYNTSREERKWLASEADLLDLWKNKILNNAIAELISLSEEEENKAIKMDSDEFWELEKKVREDLTKSVKRIFNEFITRKASDYFNLYLNSITLSYDRYTDYFPPVDQETFNLGLTGKLEGIGAQINKSDDGAIEVVSLIPGGPSFKQKELEKGDKILKVGQGLDGNFVDVTVLTLKEGLSLIRGEKGTTVRLQVKKISGEEKEISIVRDVVEIQETYARSTTFKDQDQSYGYIYLPGFYRDFDEGVNRNSTDDVIKEIKKLEEKNIQGLVFDLRNNGGGALLDAIGITGLFIESGPVVRIKGNTEELSPLYDRDEMVLFSKPLIFILNENSASASEIVAAALQDYDRALVMGTKKTFGKGTVQNFFDLNQINALKNFDRDFGAIKLTVKKFYRITGKSTQGVGVKPDVVFPSLSEAIDTKESDFPFDNLEPISFKKWLDPLTGENIRVEYEPALNKANSLVKKTSYFQKIKEKIILVRENQKKMIFSLNLEKRMKERKVFIDKLNKLDETITEPFKDFTVVEDPEDKKSYEQVWYDNISKDIQINQAMKLLKDLVEIDQAAEARDSVAVSVDDSANAKASY